MSIASAPATISLPLPWRSHEHTITRAHVSFYALFLTAVCLQAQWMGHNCRLGQTGSQDLTPSVGLPGGTGNGSNRNTL
jgi:hypothetical protein